MKRIVLATFLVASWATALYADEQIILSITDKGYTPFMMKESAQERGIMVDVMQCVAEKHNITLKTLALPKKRQEQHILSGKADAIPTAREWIENPDDFIFSEIVIKVDDVLFSLKKSPIKFNRVEDLFGKTISIHHGYIYPIFNEYFENGLIKTSKESNETMMLKNTYHQRSNATVMLFPVGRWLLKKNPFMRNKFVSSTKIVDSFGYRVMFSKKWQPFVKVFNQELLLMKANGDFNIILAKYL